MPSASVLGDPILPHACWSDGVISAGSPDVLIGGKPASFEGCAGTPHSWTCPDGGGPHPVKISAGSGTVMINGKPATRIGDPTDCGSAVSAGSADVVIG